jgi:hypothetical protein
MGLLEHFQRSASKGGVNTWGSKSLLVSSPAHSQYLPFAANRLLVTSLISTCLGRPVFDNSQFSNEAEGLTLLVKFFQ